MPCAAPSRNNLGVLGPCGFPTVPVVGGVDVSAQNLCLPHYTMKYGQAAVKMGGLDALTVFLLHADSLVDAAGHPLTAVGDARIDPAQSRFGSGSLALDGAGDYLSTPDSPDWAFGGGDFTIDCWVYFTNVAATTQTLLCQWLTPAQQSWIVRWDTGGLKLYYSLDGAAIATVLAWAWTPAANTWYHVAVVRTGGNGMAFVNGTQIGGPQAITGPLFDASAPLTIGAQSNGSWNFNGYLDEIRISKVARWTANFSVPSTPYS